ncbi:hypothetical protein D3C76_982990 [compost metagenome]
MGQFTALDIEDDEALEQVVVEHQIDVEVFAVGTDALLAGNECEALSQLQQEALQLFDKRLFDLAFLKLAGIG